jgi:hypothetical protein
MCFGLAFLKNFAHSRRGALFRKGTHPVEIFRLWDTPSGNPFTRASSQRLAMVLRHVASSTREGLLGKPAQQDHRARQEMRPQEPDCPQGAGREAKGTALDAVTARRTPEAFLPTVATAPFRGNSYEMRCRLLQTRGSGRDRDRDPDKGLWQNQQEELRPPPKAKEPSGCNRLRRPS